MVYRFPQNNMVHLLHCYIEFDQRKSQKILITLLRALFLVKNAKINNQIFNSNKKKKQPFNKVSINKNENINESKRFKI